MNHIRIPDWQSKRRRFVSRGARVCKGGQAINPYTGTTLERSDPMWHIKP